MKKILLISVVCVGLLNISQAYADMEAFENTMTQVEKLQKKAQTVQQTKEKVESVYNSARIIQIKIRWQLIKPQKNSMIIFFVPIWLVFMPLPLPSVLKKFRNV